MEEELLALHEFEALITHLKVQPLAWRLHTLRRVFAAALQSPASDEELRDTAAAAASEAARWGRDSSFRWAGCGASAHVALSSRPLAAPATFVRTLAFLEMRA